MSEQLLIYTVITVTRSSPRMFHFSKQGLFFLLKVSTVITVSQFRTVITVIYLDVSGFKVYIIEGVLFSK